MKSENFSAAIILAAIISGFAVNAFACGPFFPNNMLDAGDGAVLQAPIADFQLELERMKLAPAGPRAVPPAKGQEFYEQSTELEMNDLAAALKRKKIPGEQATVIMQAHLAERMKLNAFLKTQNEWQHFSSWVFDTNGYHAVPNTNPPPTFPGIAVTPGLPREFADYFAGAIAWHQGDSVAAWECWNRVLSLPEPERRYKSTWAAFMLAQYFESPTNDPGDDEAMKYFERVRTMAKSGFADSAGLAVAGVGGEARIYLHRKNYERAIELYLEQFAAGDDSAVISLRLTAAAALNEGNATPGRLKSLAQNPRTRRVITAYLISRHPYNDRSETATDPDAKKFFDRTDNWLAAVEAAGVKNVESAEEFALAAYQASDVDAAQRWIKRADGSPVAQWLQAKLDLRAGKIADAAALLAKVSRKFPRETPTNAPANFSQSLFVDINPEWNETIAVGRQSLGELGTLHLARGEYTEALDALLRSGYWMDAAYVAERVLTSEELKSYVDANWPPVSPEQAAREEQYLPDPEWGMTNPREQIRLLLASRLARETGGMMPLAYFPTNLAADYGTLLSYLHDGRDETLPASVRAQKLFAAAVMTRTNGMELFGTEMEPDWGIYGGSYDFGYTWRNRATNLFEPKINAASADEIERASSRHADPDRRFHYRWQAAALAWEAAQLMPDNSDDTARVLCTAGTWIKDRDPQGADKFYKALVRRCRKTVLGDEADKIRWFPAQTIDGKPPRLETIEITPELTNNVYSNDDGIVSAEFPVPGRKYEVHDPEDVYIIARAVQRLGYAVSADDILQANPGLKRGLIGYGRAIMIPEAAVSTNNPSMPDAASAGRR